jgi:hypothetical protein
VRGEAKIHSEQATVQPHENDALEAMCHLIPISFVPPDPDRSAVSWTEKPHLSPEVAMSRKLTGRPFVAERWSPLSEAVAPSTRSPRSST